VNGIVCIANDCNTNYYSEPKGVLTMHTDVQARVTPVRKYFKEGRQMTNDALYYAYLYRRL